MISLSKDFQKKILGRFETLFREVEIEDKAPSAKSVVMAGDDLYNLISSNKEIASYLSESEFTSFFQKLIFSALDSLDDSIEIENQKKLKDYLEDQVVFRERDKLLKFLTGLPYEHYVYFQTGFSLPNGIEAVEITKSISVVKIQPSVEDAVNRGVKPSAGLLAALFMQDKPLKTGDVCIRCVTVGYAEDDLNGSATKQAYRMVKYLTYLGLSTGVMQYQPWYRPIIEPSSSMKRTIFDEEEVTLKLTPSIKDFLSKIRLAEKCFEPYGQVVKSQEEIPKTTMIGRSTLLGLNPVVEGSAEYFDRCISSFKSKLSTGPQFIDLESPYKRSIERAIEWGFEGLINDNHENALIQTCVGLEAILGGGDMGRNSEDRLADRLAYLIGKDRAEREKWRDVFKKIYQLRSDIVHGTVDEISKDGMGLVYMAKNLLRRAILREITSLCSK